MTLLTIYIIGLVLTVFIGLLVEAIDPNGSVRKDNYDDFMTVVGTYIFVGVIWPISITIFIFAGTGYVLLKGLHKIFWR